MTPAAAAPDDALNVGFAGSLVGTDSYTTTEGEAMLGTLRRVDGSEEQLPGGGVRLSSPTQGIVFEASNLSLGTDTADTPFISEIEFTPTSLGSSFATVLSAGGNMYVRVKDGALEYGFDAHDGGTWSSAVKTTPLPDLDVAHQLSVFYSPQESGTTLHVSLDGTELPAATSEHNFALSEGTDSSFGFGFDVHPDAANRGFPMDIARVRVASTTSAYDPSLFEYQPEPLTTDLLNLAFDGEFDAGEYASSSAETLDGTLSQRTGEETIDAGSLALGGGTQALDWTATDPIADDSGVTASFVGEVEFTPTASQSSLATVLAVGGNLFARYNGTQFQYGFSAHTDDGWKNFTGGTPTPSADEPHVFSFAYVPESDGTVSFIAALDGVALPSLEGSALSTPNSSVTSTLSIGNEVAEQAESRGFSGTIDRARFALLNGAFSTDAFVFQEVSDPEPEECEPLDDLEPANYISVSASDCEENIVAKAAAVRPTKQQQEWQEVGLTAFIHFGINTFYNQEWGHGTEDPAEFNPTGEVDVDSWVRQLRDAGFRYAILTVKHHDGFLGYPSRYTDYDVASTPWKDGKGDILRDFTDAAHRYGMKVGVYMSPADSHEEADGVYGNGSEKSPREIPTLVENDDRAGTDHPSFTYDATDYGQYFLNTLYEVLTEYGQIDEVWFDGAEGNTTKHEVYDYPAFYDMIGQLQPNAVVAVGGRDVRWVGNEQGVARVNEWGPVAITNPDDGGKIGNASVSPFEQVGSTEDLINSVQMSAANSLHWWPTEADMKLTGGWFAHPNDVPKSGAELMTHYEQTAGRNSLMLLNVPPTTSGSFAQASVDAINAFAAERRRAFTLDHALGQSVTTEAGETNAITDGNARSSWLHEGSEASSIELDLGEPQTINRVLLGEDTLNHGQTVESFTIEARSDGKWTQVAAGDTIGMKRIVSLNDAVTADALRISITGARGSYSLANLSVYETLNDDPGVTSDIYVDCSADTAGTGTQERPLSSLEQFRDREIAPGTTIHLAEGTDCAAADVPFWGYGTSDAPITVTTYGDGSAPTIGDATAAEYFAPLTSQGWVIDITTEPGEANPIVMLSDATLSAGDSISITVSGFDAGVDVALELHSTPVSLGSITTDADGSGTVDVTIPADSAPGEHEIVAAGGDLTASAALSIIAANTSAPGGSGSEGSDASSEGALPVTGAGPWLIGLVAALMLLLTGAALARRRRRS